MSDLGAVEPLCDKSGEGRILLLPSLSADVRGVPYESAVCEGEISYLAPLPPSAALAAARFLVEVRGLPLEECEIEMNGKIYSALFSENDGKCEILVRKCKYTLSKTRIFALGVDAEVEKFSSELGEISLLGCEDEGRVSDEALQAISHSENGAVHAAAAVRVSGSELYIRYFSPSGRRGEALTCALAAVSALGVGAGRTVRISSLSGESLTLALRPLGDRLAVSCRGDPPPEHISHTGAG